MLRKYPSIIQEDFSDCGACSLLMIIQYYGSNYSLEKLKEMTRTTTDGTNAYFLIETAKQLGLNAWAAEGELKDLKLFPCIAHLKFENGYEHFIVIYKKTKKTLIVSDPAIGRRVISISEFEKQSTKKYILFSLDKKLIPYVSKNIVKDNLLNFIYQNKNLIILIIVISFLFTILNIIASYQIQFIIDLVISSYSNANLILLSSCFLILAILKTSSDYFRNYMLNHLKHKLDFKIMSDAFSQIIRLPYIYYKNKTSGDMITRLSDLNEVKDLLSQIIVTVFIDIILVLLVLVFLFKLSTTLTVIALITSLLYIILINVFAPIIKYYLKDNKEKTAELNSFLYESINGVDTVKNLNLENNREELFRIKYNRVLNSSFNFNKIYQRLSYFKDSIFEITILIILFSATKMILDDKLSLGQMISFMALINYFLEPIKSLISLTLISNNISLSLRRINSLYEVEKEDLSLNQKSLVKIKDANISFKNLSYSYNGINDVLKNINLDIKKGSKILIMGKSGSGKSTLFKLLVGLIKPIKKKIFIDDKDISNYNLACLRKEITYVSQAEIIYNDSLYNNVTLGRSIDYEEFLKIAKLSRLDKILRNDNNYQMIIEESGFNLSGGERQRIILARALVDKSKILIFDESLSQLEIDLERTILKDLFLSFPDTSIIVISHRKDNQDLYERVYNLEEGVLYG